MGEPRWLLRTRGRHPLGSHHRRTRIPNALFERERPDLDHSLDPDPGLAKCTQGSKAPDRIIWVIFEPTTLTQYNDYANVNDPTVIANWVTAIKAGLVTIQAKYPSVKRIEVMTMIRGPGTTGPGTDCQPAATTDHEASWSRGLTTRLLRWPRASRTWSLPRQSFTLATATGSRMEGPTSSMAANPDRSRRPLLPTTSCTTRPSPHAPLPPTANPRPFEASPPTHP